MNEDNRKRLGREVIARRTELGMHTTKALAEKANLTPRMLGDVENGRRDNYSSGAKAQIEHALNWMYGSIDDVMQGYSPTRLEDRRPPPLPINKDSPSRGGTTLQVDLTGVPGSALLKELERRMQSDLDYLMSRPIRHYTGLLELVEDNDEGDSNELEATQKSATSPEVHEDEEVLAHESKGSDAAMVEVDGLFQSAADESGLDDAVDGHQ